MFYDAGGGNPADYEVWGGSLKGDYEFDGATLTSITAHDESEGFSRGDIDGGDALPVGPGFIPFPSDTQDSIDLQQTTQEVRLASSGDGPFELAGRRLLLRQRLHRPDRRLHLPAAGHRAPSQRELGRLRAGELRR